MSLDIQMITISIMFGSGMLLGILLDFYQVIKERLRLTGWVISLVDLIYWLVSACLVFSLLLWSNWGELRLYIFIAIIVGFLLYFRICRLWVIRPLRLFVRSVEILIIGLIQLCYRLLWIPVVGMLRFILRIVQVTIIAPILWITRPVTRRFQTWLKRFKSKQNKEK